MKEKNTSKGKTESKRQDTVNFQNISPPSAVYLCRLTEQKITSQMKSKDANIAGKIRT